MSAEMILLYTAGGGFLLFVIVMGLGGHVMPTGSMVRSPTRRGDIMIGIFGVIMVTAAVFTAFGGWSHFFGNKNPNAYDGPLWTAYLQQGVTSVGLIHSSALDQPLKIKREVRSYCKQQQKNATEVKPCMAFMWLDSRYMPKTLPIPPESLASMTANYVYNSSGDTDRFCWLVNGKSLPNNCF